MMYVEYMLIRLSLIEVMVLMMLMTVGVSLRDPSESIKIIMKNLLQRCSEIILVESFRLISYEV